MLAKDGFLDLEEVKKLPGFPGMEALSQKKCVVVECSQNIPCNPCEAACPQNAITVGEPITNLPVVDTEKCIGCGLCVAKCPGLAIFLVDQTSPEHDIVTMPYEYFPLPENGQEVYCLSRAGKFLTMGTVAKVITSQVYDRTAVVEVAVSKGYGMEVRSFSTDKKRMAAEAEAKKDAEIGLDEMEESGMYVCRCEEITKAEVIEAIRKGATSANEVKRMLRAGMGLCQGRNCSKTIERIIAEELHIPPAEVIPATKRGPVRAIKVGGYTTLEVECSSDFYNYDVIH